MFLFRYKNTLFSIQLLSTDAWNINANLISILLCIYQSIYLTSISKASGRSLLKNLYQNKMTLQSQTDNNQYEFVLTKQSRKTYIIGLATLLIFLLTNFLIVGVWIRRKNLTLLLICKIIFKQKQNKTFNDELTSILNPSKKLLKRQPSIGIKYDQQQHIQLKYPHINEQTHKEISNQSQLKFLDPILFEEVNNIKKFPNKKIQLQNNKIVQNLRIVRDWMDSMSLFQPFLIIIFLLIISGSKTFKTNKPQQQNSGNNETLIIVGMIMMILSILLYFLINCSKILQKILTFCDNSNTKVSPLAEQNPSCNNLNKNEENTKKQIKFKSSKFITCNGIQTQISIHQNQLQRFSQSQPQKQNNKKLFSMKQSINKLPKKIQVLSHLLDTVYLVPLVISIITVTINKFFS